MAQYRTKQTVVVEAIHLGSVGYAALVAWLQANYSGTWSIVGTPDPASLHLDYSTLGGGHGSAVVGDWLIAETPLPAPVLSKLGPVEFTDRFELVP